MIRAKLFALQIEPAEQLLFFGSEFDEAHAVAAVAAVVSFMDAQGVPHTLRVHLNGPLRQCGFQFLHVPKREIDRLRGTAQFFGDAAGVDGGKTVVTQHIDRRVDDLLFGDLPYSWHKHHPVI